MAIVTLPNIGSGSDPATINVSVLNGKVDPLATDYNGNVQNVNIAAAAGIVYSKLTLTDGIVNADINSSAAIAASKLDLSTATVTTLTTTTVALGGVLTFGENSELKLDAALSADGKYCGITEAGTAGATLAFGDLVYLAAADSRWELTDANAVGTSGDVKIGICVLAAAADASATTILLWGKVRADSVFPTFTISAPVHIAEAAGDLVVAAPTTADSVTRRVGWGNTADELFFCPSNDYITHV